MSDSQDYYERCAIAAMAALIAKCPLHDNRSGTDALDIRSEIAASADDYASAMVQHRNRRIEDKP